MTEEQNIIQMPEQKESIKLTRGQRGSYGWEIKILSLDIDQLVELNEKLIKKFDPPVDMDVPEEK